MESKNTMKPFEEQPDYVPTKVTVIEMTAQNVICQSPGVTISPYTDGGTY